MLQEELHSTTRAGFSSLYHTFSLTTNRASSLLSLDIIYVYVFFDVGSNLFFSRAFGYDLTMDLLVPKCFTEPHTETTSAK